MRALGDEAGDPGLGLGECEEDLEDGMGAEPLVPRQLEDAVADYVRNYLVPNTLLGDASSERPRPAL